MKTSSRIEVVDTHTEGEPTRVIHAGGPDLGSGSMADRLAVFRERYDHIRTAVVCEPRGSDVMVGAIVLEPVDRSNAAGVIFFNNAGYLGMCGHGTIGTAIALKHLGRIGPGEHRLETPVGVVSITVDAGARVTVDNVESRRTLKNVSVNVPGIGGVTGDVAWGGNWFFLIHEHQESIELANVERLTDFSWRVRKALAAAGIMGDDGGEIDHIELFAPSRRSGIDGKNFVLCPGKAYDRSPCGTGTSAKLACLAADGKLGEGAIWRQEGIVGGVFEGSVRIVDGKILPRISGTAYVNAVASIVLDPDDPFVYGIKA